jgi:hypothetical protein
MREAVYAVIQRPPVGAGLVQGTLTNPGEDGQTIDLSSVVGARSCHMAYLQFAFANAALPSGYWSILVRPLSAAEVDIDVLAQDTEQIPMSRTLRRSHCMEIGSGGQIVVNFVGLGAEDDIEYFVKVKWYATTVALRSLPVP